MTPEEAIAELQDNLESAQEIIRELIAQAKLVDVAWAYLAPFCAVSDPFTEWGQRYDNMRRAMIRLMQAVNEHPYSAERERKDA